ncbi:MAG: Ig-like domain-containing protein [Bacteroidales bacterium]|nr:Ig-like domain-containing protein [Bacteroidales bacterium]
MKWLFYIPAVLLLFYSCASQSPLTGGSRDNEPPKLIRALPAHLSTNIKPTQLIFEFNEFIQLRSLNQKLLVSPPLKNPFHIKIKPKSFSIILKDTLLENTTYQFYFADAITDLNEGNPLSDFTYVFSTGNSIDSLSFGGKIRDAFTLKPESQFSVCLYTDTSDSCVLKSNPTYITRSNNDGIFQFNYLKNGSYKLVAFNDKNNNYRFDAESEKIAFYSNEVDLTKHYDSLILYSFQENRSKQFIKKIERKKAYMATIILNNPSEQRPMVEHSTASIYNIVYSNNNDTMHIFFADSSQYKNDTIFVTIGYIKHDSLLNSVRVKETKPCIMEHQNKKPIHATYKLPIKNNIVFSSKSILYILFSEPTNLTDKNISVWQQNSDTTFKKIPIIVERDTSNPLKYLLYGSLKDGKKYRIILHFDSLYSVYQHKYNNDTILFSTYEKENFGLLKLTYMLPNENRTYTFELLNDKQQVIYSWNDNRSNQKNIDYVLPGNYTLRCIADENKNGKWDTGFYFRNLQPEKVYTYPSTVTLRANWDLEINWEIK